MELDTSIIAQILNIVAPFAISLGVTFAVAETVFQWFLRVAFGKITFKTGG